MRKMAKPLKDENVTKVEVEVEKEPMTINVIQNERANHLQNRLKNQKSKKGISRKVQGCRMVLVLIRMLSRSTNQMN